MSLTHLTTTLLLNTCTEFTKIRKKGQIYPQFLKMLDSYWKQNCIVKDRKGMDRSILSKNSNEISVVASPYIFKPKVHVI